MKTFLATLLLMALACAAPPLGAPDQMAQRIAVAIEEGDPESASRMFERADTPDYRERMYPVLYGRAGQHYERGDTAGAAALLHFMHEHYAESDAVREALLYSLFLERAQRTAGSPEDELDRELDQALSAVLADDATPPVWVDLIQTQRAIDGGRTAEAQEAYARFRAAWDGQPAEMNVYVEDLGRYLSLPDAPGGGSR